MYENYTYVICEGTTRTIDVVAAMTLELGKTDDSSAGQKAVAIGQCVCEPTHERIEEYLGNLKEELWEKMDEIAASRIYVMFGTHPGDGAMLGFWPDTDRAYDAMEAGEIGYIEDPKELEPENWERLANFKEPQLFLRSDGEMNLYVWDTHKEEYELYW